MTRNKLISALKKACELQGIKLSNLEFNYHLHKLELENIPNGITEQNLQEILFDYLTTS